MIRGGRRLKQWLPLLLQRKKTQEDQEKTWVRTEAAALLIKSERETAKESGK
jgi:hypothetical protein